MTNPENGTFTHFYDASGNVSQTNLPQGGSVTYTYDLIERRTFSDYSDANTPDVTITWDTSSKMRLYRSRAHTGATTVAQTTFGSYDPLGRALTSSQDIIGAASAFNFTYTYDRAGNLRTMGYPSGRSLTITYTTGSLISALSGTKSSVTTNYLTSPSYTPFGALSQVSLANGLIERTDYLNGLPQVRQIRLGDSGNATLRGDWQFRYCNYGASPFFRADSCSANNGNVLGQIHTISGASFNQTYQYDDVNRLCTVRETSSTTPLAPRACGDATGLSGDTWYQSYMFDRWGNMAVKATPGVTPHPLTVSLLSAYNTANNRLTGSNWAYDAAGNMTTHGGWTLAYDSANRRKTSQPSGGSVTSYVYDADGRRVKKTTGSTSTYFVYDAFGQLAAEYASTDPTGTTETHYLTTDHLGSTRLVTNQTGAVLSRHDYLPFGWELYSGLTGRTNGHGYLTSPEGIYTPTQRFTGKERDSETRLDYFGARYYTAGPGRFTSADPKLTSGRPEDPQTWNRYSYVTNNPLRLIDPDGRDKWEAFLQSARAWWDEMWRPAAGMASGSVEPPASNPPSGPGFDNSQVVRRHAEEVGKGTTFLKDTLMLADISGAGAMLEAGMKRDGPGTVLAMGMAALPGPNVENVASKFGFKSFRIDGSLVGGELMGGGSAAVSFLKSGNTFGVNISLVTGPAGTLSRILEGSIAAAKAEGASTLVIGATMVKDSVARLLRMQGFKEELKDGNATGRWIKEIALQ